MAISKPTIAGKGTEYEHWPDLGIVPIARKLGRGCLRTSSWNWETVDAESIRGRDAEAKTQGRPWRHLSQWGTLQHPTFLLHSTHLPAALPFPVSI